MNSRCLPLILLLLCCSVSLASAGGMAKISVSPAEANWKTGQTVEVNVMLDNNLNPLAKDISIYLDWNAEMLKYDSCDFKVGHSTASGLLSSHELNLMVGDFTDGYKNGDYPLAALKFRVIGPGDTPILVKVARLNDMENNPVKFVTGKGMYSIMGDAVDKPSTLPTSVATTYVPSNGQPTVIVVTPGTFTVPPTVVAPPTVLPTTYQAPTVIPVQQNTVAPGSVPAWPVLTAGATVPTTLPTTQMTTIPTAIPTTVVTTVITTVPTQVFTTVPTRALVTTAPTTTVPTTTVTTTVPTTTVTEEETWTPIPTTFGQIAYQTGGIGIETPTPEETPEETPSIGRTLPSPLGGASNWTDEDEEVDGAEWPANENPTQTPAFGGRTGNDSVVNNTSASLGPVGSIFGDAWMIILAGVAGIALVTVGVVAVRRTRDDEL